MANQVILEFVGDPSGLKPVADALQAIGNLTKAQVESFNKANADFAGKTKQTFAPAEKSLDDLSKKFKQVQQAIAGGNAKQVFAGMADGLAEIGITGDVVIDVLKEFGFEQGKVTEKSKTLIGQLRAMKQELAGMDVGDEGFEELSIRAARLEDKIGDVRERVRVLASDTFKFDAAVGAIRGVAAAFTLAQAGAALLGEENEDVQKAILKVQAAMAGLTAVQELANLATGQGAAKLGVLTIAQNLFTFATSGATVAVKAFRAALIATGIGAIVAGIALLVTHWDELKDAIGFADQDAKKFHEAEIRRVDFLIKRNELLGKSTDDLRKKKIQLQLQEATASGDTDKQLELLNEKKLLDIEIERLKAKRGFEAAKTDTEIALALAKKGSIEELNLRKKLIDQERAIRTAGEQLTQDQIIDLTEVAYDKKIQLDKEFVAERALVGVAQAEANLAKELQGTEGFFKAKAKLIEAETALQKKQAIATIQDARLLAATLEKIQAESDIKKNQLSNDILASGVNQARLQSEIDFVNDTIDLENSINGLIKKNLAERRKLEEDAANELRLIEEDKLIGFEEKELKKQQLAQQTTVALRENAKQLNSILNTERKKEIDAEQRHQKALQQLILDDSSATIAQKRDARGKIFDIELDALNKEKDALDAQLKQNVILYEDYARQIQDIDDQVAKNRQDKRESEIEAELEMFGATMEVALQVSDAIFQISSDRRDAEFEAELAQLDREKEAALSNKNLTENQRAKIEEQFRKKEAQIKREQFIAEKEAKGIEVIIATALAVAKAAPNPVLMAFAALTGVLSAAIIAAQPIPKFRTGTRNAPGGWALVGEEGPELVNIPKGGKVITHPETQRVLAGMDIRDIANKYGLPALQQRFQLPHIDEVITKRVVNGQQFAFDYKKLGEEIAKHPRNIITMDENGFSLTVQRGGDVKRFVNKRYSAND